MTIHPRYSVATVVLFTAFLFTGCDNPEATPVTCEDLACQDENRLCVDHADVQDALCGDCEAGYVTIGDRCVEDRCAASPDACGELEVCVNTLDRLTCECMPGYQYLEEACVRSIDDVALGKEYSCAIAQGELYCWGANPFGELGLGDRERRTTPTRVGDKTHWTVISLDYSMTCGIESGMLYCWGANTAGRLGTGDTTTELFTVPTPIGTLTQWTSVSVGDGHICGIESGKLYCWGYNGSGQLGTGNTTYITVPTRIGTLTQWESVYAQGYQTCGTENNTLYCWGDNRHGHLGMPTPQQILEPTPVPSSTPWSGVSLGSAHTCFLNDETLHCFGDNEQGQCGVSAPGDTTVQGGHRWRHFAAGMFHTCGATENKLYCWGEGENGRLGNGSDAVQSAPVAIDSVDRQWDHIALGRYHSCALAQGSLYCWGSNGQGELGVGHRLDVHVPTHVVIP